MVFPVGAVKKAGDGAGAARCLILWISFCFVGGAPTKEG